MVVQFWTCARSKIVILRGVAKQADLVSRETELPKWHIQ